MLEEQRSKSKLQRKNLAGLNYRVGQIQAVILKLCAA
jgi:hypothetical protein